MTVAEKQQQLVEELLIVEDAQERLSVVVTRASKANLAVQLKTPERLVKGCVSQVWLDVQVSAGVCSCTSDADSPMVKGLVRLLCDVYDGGRAEDVLATEPNLWQPLGFHKMLSPTRINGLSAVRTRIKELVASSVE